MELITLDELHAFHNSDRDISSHMVVIASYGSVAMAGKKNSQNFTSKSPKGNPGNTSTVADYYLRQIRFRRKIPFFPPQIMENICHGSISVAKPQDFVFYFFGNLLKGKPFWIV